MRLSKLPELPPAEPGITSVAEGGPITFDKKGGGVSLSELEAHLWESANILRGPVDQADFKS